MGEKWKLYDLTESLLYFIVRLNHPILFMYVTKPKYCPGTTNQESQVFQNFTKSFGA